MKGSPQRWQVGSKLQGTMPGPWRRRGSEEPVSPAATPPELSNQPASVAVARSHAASPGLSEGGAAQSTLLRLALEPETSCSQRTSAAQAPELHAESVGQPHRIWRPDSGDCKRCTGMESASYDHDQKSCLPHQTASLVSQVDHPPAWPQSVALQPDQTRHATAQHRPCSLARRSAFFLPLPIGANLVFSHEPSQTAGEFPRPDHKLIPRHP